jgi:hypothetical protein
MATNFYRTFVDDRSFIRGAGRMLVTPVSSPMPGKISDVIALAPVSAADDVQTFSEGATVPTGGTFTVTLDMMPGGVSSPVTSAPIAYNATAAAVQTALTGMSNIGAGNVTCTGGPLPGTPVVATFGGTLADEWIPEMTIDPASLTPAGASVVVAHTTEGTPALSLYDAQPGWTDVGATKGGMTITINNGEDTFDIDQQLTIIASQPNSWTCTVGTSLAESTPERMQLAWEGSAITVDTTPTSGPEQQIGFGAPNFYIQRRVAIVFQRPSGYIRGYFFRICQRSPQESSLVHAKTGDQQSIPILFNCLADNKVTDVLSQLFIIRDQAVPGLDLAGVGSVQ